MPSKRVVIRVHEAWLDDYLKITNDWFITHGYASADDNKFSKGLAKQDTRLGYIGGGRFHIIIDLAEDEAAEPVDISDIPLEIYRVFRGNDGQKMTFTYVDEKKQSDVYSAVREFGRDFTWGC